jgi:glucose repression regulatory protein TUP1
MAGQGGQGGPGLAPPPQQDQPQGPPQHQMPQPPPGLQQGPPPPQVPFQPGGYPQASAPNGYGAQGPPPTASPGPGKPRLGRGPGGPATPQLNQPMPYPDARGSPQIGHPTPDHRSSQLASVGNNLAELDLERLAPHQKKVSDDWFAIFNPNITRVLDVDLLHTLPHESVVCCVRFSHDGKYVATGCNRSAQIFDVQTGQKVCVLQDDSVEAVGDLYIRSVCFSPDGKYLATGAEDKLIRVCFYMFLVILHITNFSSGLGYCFQ